MAKNLNRAQIIGHLGRDPEMRATASGMSVCKVSVATSEKYKSKSGEWQENTEWHRVVFFDKLADIANQYLNKGSKVYIEGRLQTSSWEKDGVTRYMTEIIAQNMIMLDSREGGGGGSYGGGQSGGSYESGSNEFGGDFGSDVDDEVPF